MNITRRGWLGASAAGAAALATPGLATAQAPGPADRIDIPTARFEVTAPGAGAHDYAPALEALAAYARAELTAIGLPGMTLCVTDSEGFTALLALGWADIERREPITTGRLFQIGSISKSFLALAVLSLADEGKIDIDAPIARYLPGAPWPEAPITAAQIMSHTAGLPGDAPLLPRTPEGRLWTGFTAGSKFSYSNTGFNLLGAAVAHVTGLSHQEAILRRVRGRLGLSDIAGEIDAANRARFPEAYIPRDQTRAAGLPGAVLDKAKWDPEDIPAGCIGASAPMIARYLRALLAIGAGKGAPVLSDAAARRFATGVIAADEDFGPGSKYAMGVAIQPVAGLPCLHHTGGMVAFSSSFHADPAAGVAAFASVNARMGGYRPRQTTAFAVALMRAVRAGAPLPAPPDPLRASKIKDPAPLYGRFVAADGQAFDLAAGGDFPRFEAVGASAPLYRAGGVLATPHELFARHSLDPVMANGEAAAFWWGDTLFTRNAPATQPAAPDRLRSLAGAYLNRDPWVGYAVVLARGDKLVLEGVGQLAERGAWWSPEKDVGGVERFAFDGVLNGRASRLNVSGTDLLRLAV